MANTSWTNSSNLVTSRIGWTSAGRTGDDPVVKLEAIGSDVGVGTAVPNNKLTVIGNISATGNIWLSSGPVGSGGSSSLAGIDDQTSSNDDQLTIKDGEVVINDDSDDLDFRVESNGDANALFVNGGTDKVGVGTSAPDEKLTVIGGISATAGLSAYNSYFADNVCIGKNVSTFELDVDGTIGASTFSTQSNAGTSQVLYIKSNGGVAFVADQDNNDTYNSFYFYVNGTSDANKVLTFDTSGYVGIGAGAISPAERLTVIGNISARGDVVATGMASISGDLHVGDDLVVKGNNASINGINYAWPSSDGSNGYQLTTNGSGTLSWAAAGGSGGGEANEYSFKTVSVSSRDTSIPWRADVIADTTTDTFTLCAGPNIELISDSTTDTITISARDTSGSGGGSGDITAVVAGDGIVGGATSGSATVYISAGALLDVTANEVAVDLTESSEAAIANGDYILFLDGGATGAHAKEAIHDVATLFAGTGLTASSSVINIDAAQTGITSLLATDIKIGEDDQTKIDFETVNEIHLYANNTNKATVHGTGIQLLGHTNELSAMGPAVFSGTTVLSGATRSAGSITTTGEVKTTANVVASGGHTLNHTELGFAVSDESTNLTTGTAKLTFRMPFAMHLTAVRANVNTAPVGSTIIVDINEGGSTILTTKLSIDASEKTSTSAASQAVIGGAGPVLADDAEMKVDIDQIGSSTAGKGLKLWLIGHRI